MKFVILATLFVASQASLEMYNLQPTDMCCWWASLGECETNAFWMRPNCQSQCGTDGCDVSDAANCVVSVRSDCVEWNEQSEGYQMWVDAYNNVNGGDMESAAVVEEPAPLVEEQLPLEPVVEEELAPEPMVDNYAPAPVEEVVEPVVEEVVEPVVEVPEMPEPEPIIEEPIEVILELPAVEEVVEPSGYQMEDPPVVEAPAPIEMAPLPAEPVVEELPVEEPVVEEAAGYGSVEPAPLEPVVDEVVEQDAVVDQVVDEPEVVEQAAGELVNNHKLCSYWAFIGECEQNGDFMKMECGLACQDKRRRRRS